MDDSFRLISFDSRTQSAAPLNGVQDRGENHNCGAKEVAFRWNEIVEEVVGEQGGEHNRNRCGETFSGV